MEKIVLKTELENIPLVKRGKVRDIYYVVGDQLLIIATDRLSVFDVVLPDGIPHKGEILTKLSEFWFNRTKHIIRNHVVSFSTVSYPPALKKHKELLENRSVLVKKAQPLPIECVVRGYLSGSAWHEYEERGSVCGIDLPEGLLQSSVLDEPIFTPATKAETGHDVNITEKKATDLIGEDLYRRVKDISIQIYKEASEYAFSRGIMIADTKLEFGLLNHKELILIDELLTPDSSRFWPANEYAPGKPQKSFDKQYVRDFLVGIGWNKEPPAPKLPQKVIENTSRKYIEAYEWLTGRRFGDVVSPYVPM